MNKTERNYWYRNLIQRFVDTYKDFFELDNNDLYWLSNIAEAIRCKSENGKSAARTLFDRAKEGRPF